MKDLFGVIGGQQSEIDSLNFLGNQIMQCNDDKIRDLVQKHLDGLNENWERVKDKVLTEPSVFAPHYEEKAAETPLFVADNPAIYDISAILDGTDELRGYIEDDHLRYQLLFSDVFDWLVKCEESLRSMISLGLTVNQLEQLAIKQMVRIPFQHFKFRFAFYFVLISRIS